jgi:hypothetical protein
VEVVAVLDHVTMETVGQVVVVTVVENHSLVKTALLILVVAAVVLWTITEVEEHQAPAGLV